MNVSLTPELERFVSQKVKSGMYHSASEVIRESLRLLKEKDGLRRAQFDKLCHAINDGIQDIENGDYKEYNEDNLQDLVEEIKTTGRKSRANEKTGK